MPASIFVRSILLPLVVLLLNSVSPRAAIIYDNSDTGGTNVYYATFEYGDEIVLGGTDRLMSSFLFEYYGDFTPVGDETAQLRIYKGDGPLTSDGDPTPGTLLYDSSPFQISPGWQTKKFSGLSVTVPGSVIWTIQFNGMVGITGDQAGLVLRPKPSVGTSYDDIWEKRGGQWSLVRWGGNPLANFAARIVSGSDPTTISIRRDSSKVVVEWSGLSILQVSDSATGPFTDLLNARNRYEMNPGGAGMKFWRLRD